MKIYGHFILILFAFACHDKKPNELFISQDSKDLSLVDNVVIYKNHLFNGVLFDLGVNRDTLVSQQVRKGVPDGITKKLYANHQLMEYREYKHGQKNGLQIAYWENGKKRFEYTAKNDVCEGELKEWSINGSLFHLAHYVNGQEDGIQKLWHANGKIRANYVIIKGKRYGLLGTKNCRNVSDSIFMVK